MARGEKTGGRKIGTPNKLTASVKDTFKEAFEAIQGLDDDDPRSKAKLFNWGVENPDKFYPLAAKLIPTEVVGGIKHAFEPLVIKTRED